MVSSHDHGSSARAVDHASTGADPLAGPVRFRLDDSIVEFTEWPICRARTQAGRRCRNHVIDTGQTGRYLPRTNGDVPGWEVDRLEDLEKLQEQYCRTHLVNRRRGDAVPYEGQAVVPGTHLAGGEHRQGPVVLQAVRGGLEVGWDHGTTVLPADGEFRLQLVDQGLLLTVRLDRA